MTLYPSLNGGRSSLWSPFNFTGKKISFQGDSITFGANASVIDNCYASLLSASLGAISENNGVGGATMEKRTPNIVLGVGANSMLDRLSAIPTKTSAYALLTFAFGVNDWGCKQANYNPTNFKLDFQTVLNNAYGKGWAKNEILIIAPTYVTDQAVTFYSTISNSHVPPDKAGLPLFEDACTEIATAEDLNIVYLFDVIKNNTPTSLLDPSDGLHPIDAGHALIAETIENLLTGSVAPNVFIGQNIVVSKSNISFNDAGITADNTTRIYLIPDFLTYVPGRTINGITGFEQNKGYYLTAKQDIALSSVLVPPL